MEEKNKIFRQKSLDRVSSPEELDKYIKTTTPSLWVLLVAIIVFLFGVIVWGVTGKIESNLKTGFVTDGTNVKFFISEEYKDRLTEDSYIEINDNKYEITNISKLTNSNEINNEYLLHMANLSQDDWYYVASGKCNLSAGEYSGKIVFEVISPIKFVLN